MNNYAKEFLKSLHYIAQTEKDYPFLMSLYNIAKDWFSSEKISKIKVDDYWDILKNIKGEYYTKKDTAAINIISEVEDLLFERIERGYFNAKSNNNPAYKSMSVVEEDEEDDYDAYMPYWNAKDNGIYDDIIEDFGKPTVDANFEEFGPEFWEDYEKQFGDSNDYWDYKSNYVKSKWDNIPDFEDKDYYVIAYGSLINSRSRSKTIKDSSQDCPVRVNGWSRIFNVGLSKGTVLNVFKSDDWVNAVLLKVNKNDMENLYLRELLYSAEFLSKADISFPYGKTMEIPDDEKVVIFVSYMDTQEYPKMDYVHTCIHGAFKYGEEFVKDFINTTYTHDIKPFKTWLSTHVGKKNFANMMRTDGTY